MRCALCYRRWSMFTFDYLLAVVLLTTPSEMEESATVPEQYAALCPTLQDIAVQWELMDPRELRYMLIRAEDLPTDLKLLRRRYQELADAPYLHDCERFPDRTTVSELLAFNRSYRQQLDGRQSMELTRWWE